MANSSEWITALPQGTDVLPDWISGLAKERGFAQGWPARAKDDAMAHQEPEASTDDPNETEEAAAAIAYAEGEAAGRAAAKAEADVEIASLKALRTSFRQLDQAAMDCLANELAHTVQVLCEQVLSEFSCNPDQLIERAKTAAQQLGSVATGIKLHVHPDDLPIVENAFDQSWKVIANSQVHRGGLIIEAGEGTLHDGPDEWRRAIAEALRQ